MKIHILDDWFDSLRHLPCFEKLQDHDVTIWNDHISDIDILANRLQQAECLVLFRERTKITKPLLDKLPKLKLISQRSVYPHIDVDACTQNGVLLCSNMHKDSASMATVEHVWALILATMRQLPQQMQSLQQGNWQMGVGRTLHGRILGLYGYGRIAKEVARIADAFGMKVVWWASDDGRVRALNDGQHIASSRKEFFATPDIISLHVRLKPSTQHIITSDDFKYMRNDSIFVNTSRAGLIAPNALLDGLNKGKPQMAAIDVFDIEPITWQNDSLATHPNVIATPHIGFVSNDEYNIQFADIFDQIIAYATGRPIHMVNPEIWK